MPQIGVDEWVAQSGDRREQGTGLGRALATLDARVGWWPRLALAAAVGLAFGLTTGNVNLLTVGFTCLLYAILSLGLNIAAGWSGLLDLGYIAFVGFGAYGYAIFSSSALGSRRLGRGPPRGLRVDPDRRRRRRPGRRARSAWSRCASRATTWRS